MLEGLSSVSGHSIHTDLENWRRSNSRSAGNSLPPKPWQEFSKKIRMLQMAEILPKMLPKLNAEGTWQRANTWVWYIAYPERLLTIPDNWSPVNHCERIVLDHHSTVCLALELFTHNDILRYACA